MGTVHRFILGCVRLILPCLQLFLSGDLHGDQWSSCGVNTWYGLVFFLGVVPRHGHLCFCYNCWWDSSMMVYLTLPVDLVVFGTILEP